MKERIGRNNRKLYSLISLVLSYVNAGEISFREQGCCSLTAWFAASGTWRASTLGL
jgi:hypothetical protein